MMTNLPDDPIDSYEPRLARRVGAFAEQAVRPFDALAVATAARARAGGRTIAGRLFGNATASARLGLVLVGGVLLVAAIATFISAGGDNLFTPSQTSTANVPEATPTDLPGAVGMCAAASLTGEITAWEGAAGHRIATVSLRNAGASCALPQYLLPALVDANGSALIVGEFVPEPAPITFPAGANVESFVDMSNYCGVKAPVPPLGIRLSLPDQSSVELSPGAGLPNAVDLPPCNGVNEPAQIHMQPLHLVTPG